MLLMKEIKILGILCLLYASALILALPSDEVGVQGSKLQNKGPIGAKLSWAKRLSF